LPTDHTNATITREQAIAAASEYLINYSYTTLGGIQVKGIAVSSDQATSYLLTTPRDRHTLSTCWTVTFNLTYTYPDGVNQLFVTLWADTGKVFASGNLSPTRYLTNTNPTPTPTPTTSPSPSPSTSATPSSSPSPSQTLNPSASPTLTVEPSPSQTASPTQQPTSTPNQPTLQEAYYIVTLVAVVVIVVALALLLRNPHRNQSIE
jgi:hypothetical protein